MDDSVFRRVVLRYYRRHGRHALPWRIRTDPYAVLVSELMLQQTQVDRVIPFFTRFVTRFPSFGHLARARQVSVLKAWQGLGYNRRALNLHRCAKAVVAEHGGRLPGSYEDLVALPGIGPYTAGAILAFAFDTPYPLIETNVRRVYLHHYFPGCKNVSDARILDVVERTLDRSHPRRWFSALMDYGSHLARTVENPNRRSRQYTRQSRFEGSDRQVRSSVVRFVLAERTVTERRLCAELDVSPVRLRRILDGLRHEGFLMFRAGKVTCV